jgi:signal transduction histidine kinase
MKLDIQWRMAEELSKNLQFILFHLVVLLTTYYLTHDLFSKFNEFYPFIFILGGLSLRVFILRFFLEAYLFNPFIKMFFLGAVVLSGLGWGLVFQRSFFELGFYNIQTLFILGSINSLVAGSASSFATDRRAAAFFIVSLSSMPLFILLTSQNDGLKFLGLLLLGNSFYQIFHSRSSYAYIRSFFLREKREKEEKLFLQDLIDAMPGIVALIDAHLNYKIVSNFKDGKYARILLGKKVGSSPLVNLEEIILSFINSKEDHLVREVSVKEEGTENWYMVNLRSLPAGDHLVAILPINELVKTRTDLKIQEARSQYASKLASLGEMAAGIAHEVSNPLTIIEGSSNVISMAIEQDPMDTETIEIMSKKIIQTTQRIGKIIKSMKTLSRKGEDEVFDNISLQSILDPVIEISRKRMLAQNIDFRVNTIDQEATLFGSEVQLGQVIMNLISNAMDAVEQVQRPWIEIGFQCNIEWCDILIMDSGPGISKEVAEKIMDPFFSTKRSDQGTGLGLSISKTIVESHNGELSLIKEQGPTTFRVRLPRMTVGQKSKTL